MNYWLETRSACQHCLGDLKCFSCGGNGCYWEDDSYSVECEECHGSGACQNCEGGRETWLFFTSGNGKRGSCLTRSEIVAWRADGTLPDWWNGYHGLTTERTKERTNV